MRLDQGGGERRPPGLLRHQRPGGRLLGPVGQGDEHLVGGGGLDSVHRAAGVREAGGQGHAQESSIWREKVRNGEVLLKD